MFLLWRGSILAHEKHVSCISSRVHPSFCSVKKWRMRTWNPPKVILLHNMWPQCFRTNLLLACKISALNIFSYNSFLHSWVDCDPGRGSSSMCSTESSTIKMFLLVYSKLLLGHGEIIEVVQKLLKSWRDLTVNIYYLLTAVHKLANGLFWTWYCILQNLLWGCLPFSFPLPLYYAGGQCVIWLFFFQLNWFISSFKLC